MTILHYISSRVFLTNNFETSRKDLSKKLAQKKSQKNSYNNIPRVSSFERISEIGSQTFYGKKNEKIGEANIINEIITNLWKRIDVKLVMEIINQILSEIKPNILDKLLIKKIDFGNE